MRGSPSPGLHGLFRLGPGNGLHCPLAPIPILISRAMRFAPGARPVLGAKFRRAAPRVAMVQNVRRTRRMDSRTRLLRRWFRSGSVQIGLGASCISPPVALAPHGGPSIAPDWRVPALDAARGGVGREV